MWLHATVLCGCEAGCEVLAEHGAGSREHEDQPLPIQFVRLSFFLGDLFVCLFVITLDHFSWFLVMDKIGTKTKFEKVPMPFTREMAVYKRQNRHDVFVSRICPRHVFDSTF